MESSGRIYQKFIKYLSTKELIAAEISIPHKLRNTYETLLSDEFLLKFRNDYQTLVYFNRAMGTISGMQTLFGDFGFRGGEMLIFEFDGVYDLNVYVINCDLKEFDYPNLVHYSQKTKPRVVSMHNGGLWFINFIDEKNPVADEFEPPVSFKRSCPSVQTYHNYVFSNGKMVEGHYDRGSGKFVGISRFTSIPGLDNFSNYNLLICNYEPVGMVTISVFDDDFVEVFFPGTPLSMGGNSHNPTVRGKFEIVVQPFHMSKYCYGVDVSTEFEDISIRWRKKDYIKVYSNDLSWKLQVRYRKNRSCHRTTIHDGQIKFRDDLGLEVGDLCIFESTTGRYEHFNIRVIKRTDL